MCLSQFSHLLFPTKFTPKPFLLFTAALAKGIQRKRKEKSMYRHHGAVATLLSPLLTQLPSRYEFVIKSLHEFDRDVSLVALCSYHIIFSMMMERRRNSSALFSI
jgi:hypothetical protein